MGEREFFESGELKVVTNGIKNRLDPNLQSLLWIEIYLLRDRDIKVDNMQVFKLKTVRTRSKDTLLLKVTHTQEDPFYENSFSIKIEPDQEANGTVWVIDDYSHATMMWEEEY